MKCKIGDLAIIVKATVPANLGALVEVIDLWPEEHSCWIVRSLNGPRERNDGTWNVEAVALDRFLRPIRGGGQPAGASQGACLLGKTLRTETS